MNREDEKKNTGPEQNNVQQTPDPNAPGLRTDDDEQRSYPGKLDQVEGSMNNGETGGGLGRDSQ